MKKLLFPLLTIALLGFGAVYWISDNLGEIAAGAITHYGSAMTKARAGVEHVVIHPSTGKGVISGLVIGNPRGFRAPHSVRVEAIDIDVDPATLANDVIVVRMLLVNKPDVIYEKGDTLTNFDVIELNIEAYLAPEGKRFPRGNTRLIVEELTIANATAHASAPFLAGRTMSIPLPDIALRDIGKAKGGVTPAQLGREIAEALNTKLSIAGNFDRLRRSAGLALGETEADNGSLFN